MLRGSLQMRWSVMLTRGEGKRVNNMAACEDASSVLLVCLPVANLPSMGRSRQGVAGTLLERGRSRQSSTESPNESPAATSHALKYASSVSTG